MYPELEPDFGKKQNAMNEIRVDRVNRDDADLGCL